jgi:DNA-binding transcriptional MocR family regulator
MDGYWGSRLSQFAETVVASEIRELLKVVADPRIISFAGGIPDSSLFPMTAMRDAYRKIFESNALCLDAFQYSTSEGYPPLRQWISEHMAGRGILVQPENILITSGAQQGLDFASKLLLNRGDLAVVSQPSYLGALQTLGAYGARFISVPMDDEGMLVEPLEHALKQDPKLVYLVPDFANPSGVTMSISRRLALVTLARRYGVPIIEDTAYERLRYEGELLAPIIALDEQQRKSTSSGQSGNVIFLGTFSKIIAPALRIGWMLAPAPLAEKLVLLKQSNDLHCSTVNQMILAEILPGTFEKQVEKIIPVYRARRDAMLKALEMHFPPHVTWTRPAGGMFIWAQLPARIDAVRLLETALSEVGVAFVPGAAFYADRSGTNTLRLSFSTVDPEKINTGIRDLGRILRGMLG